MDPLPQTLDELNAEWLTETFRAEGLIGTVARLRLDYDRDEADANGATRRDLSLGRHLARLGVVRLEDLLGWLRRFLATRSRPRCEGGPHWAWIVELPLR